MDEAWYLKLAQYLGFGVGSGIVAAGTIWLKRMLGQRSVHAKQNAMTGHMNLYARLQKRADFACHDMRSGRVKIYEYSNGGVYASTKQQFKMTCTIEAVENASVTKDVFNNVPISIFMPHIAVFFKEVEDVPGTKWIVIADSDDREHDIGQVIEDDLEECRLKSYMIENGIKAAYFAPLVDDSKSPIGFVVAHFMDEKWNNAETVPDSLYILAYFAYNVQSDLSLPLRTERKPITRVVRPKSSLTRIGSGFRLPVDPDQ